MRLFIGIVVILVLCALALLLYGQTLEPETRQIKIEVEPHAFTQDPSRRP